MWGSQKKILGHKVNEKIFRVDPGRKNSKKWIKYYSHSRSRSWSFPRMEASDSLSRTLGMGFFNSLPVPEPSKVIPAHPWAVLCQMGRWTLCPRILRYFKIFWDPSYSLERTASTSFALCGSKFKKKVVCASKNSFFQKECNFASISFAVVVLNFRVLPLYIIYIHQEKNCALIRFGRKALHQYQVHQVLDACQLKPLSSHSLSLYLTWKLFSSLGIMFCFKSRYFIIKKFRAHFEVRITPLKTFSSVWSKSKYILRLPKMISRSWFKISNVQVQNIQIQNIECSPFVDTVTAGHWGGAGRRPWETENLLRARQLVPHLTHNVLPLFPVAARATWQSLIAWCWRPSRKIAPPLWRLELQSPPSR